MSAGGLLVGDGYDDEPLMTAKDVAKALRLPAKAVYELPLPRVVLGPRRIRWRPEDVRAFARSTKVLKSVGGHGYRVAIVRRANSPYLYLRWGHRQWMSLGHNDVDAALVAARNQAAVLLSERGAVMGGVALSRVPENIQEVRRQKATGFVYVIEAVGLSRVKIGFTKDLAKRLRSLTTAAPAELRVLHVWEATPKLEQRLHRELASRRLVGEWFPASVVPDAERIAQEWLP